MISRTASMLTVLGAAANLTLAQAQSDPPVTVTYHLSWMEVSAVAPYAPVHPDGRLDPGEGARFAFYASLDPGPGTPITYPASLLPGSAGAGVLRGLWAGAVNLSGNGGSSSAAGTWVLNQNTTPSANPNRLGVLPPFALGYPDSSGTPNPNGAVLQNIGVAQSATDPSGLNTQNPTGTMWRGVWIPGSYSQRYATFELGLSTFGFPTEVFAEDNASTFPIVIDTFSAYTSVTIPIIPAPPGLALLAAVAALTSIRHPRQQPETRASA